MNDELAPRALFFMHASSSEFPFKSCEHEKFKEINKIINVTKMNKHKSISIFPSPLLPMDLSGIFFF